MSVAWWQWRHLSEETAPRGRARLGARGHTVNSFQVCRLRPSLLGGGGGRARPVRQVGRGPSSRAARGGQHKPGPPPLAPLPLTGPRGLRALRTGPRPPGSLSLTLCLYRKLLSFFRPAGPVRSLSSPVSAPVPATSCPPGPGAVPGVGHAEESTGQLSGPCVPPPTLGFHQHPVHLPEGSAP